MGSGTVLDTLGSGTVTRASTLDSGARTVANIRQSRPGSGLGFEATVLEMLKGVPSSLGSGSGQRDGAGHERAWHI